MGILMVPRVAARVSKSTVHVKGRAWSFTPGEQLMTSLAVGMSGQVSVGIRVSISSKPHDRFTALHLRVKAGLRQGRESDSSEGGRGDVNAFGGVLFSALSPPPSWGALQEQGGGGVGRCEGRASGLSLGFWHRTLDSPACQTLRTRRRHKPRGDCNARSGGILLLKILGVDAKAGRGSDLRAGGQKAQNVFDRR